MASKKISELKLDWETLEAMAQRFATLEELAAFANLSQAEFKRAVRHHRYYTLVRWMAKHAAIGKYLIRQAQFNCAMGIKSEGASENPSPTMLKWLGVQHLGQAADVKELNKPLPPAEKVPSGFEILSPKAAVLVGPQATIDVTPARPHDEKPAVAAIIEAELVEGFQEPDQSKELIAVSGHTGERL